MKKNMGNSDRILRILLAILFGVIYFTNTVTGTSGQILVVSGVVFLLTSLVSVRPLCSIFGISTCTVKKSNA